MMNKLGSLFVLVWLFAARLESVTAGPCEEYVPEEAENEIDKSQVTHTGDVQATASGFYSITDPQTRATVHTGYNDNHVKLKFRFRGNTTTDIPFGSGLVRRQIGLKLASENICNVIYVMWEVSPTERISVFQKSNPGETTSSECGNGGYERLYSDTDFGVTLDTAEDGSTHRMSAHLQPLRDSYDPALNDYKDFRLSVCADGETIFEKLLEDLPSDIRGPAGFRTDNGDFIFKLFAA